MEGGAAKPKGRKRVTKKQEAAALAAAAAAAAATATIATTTSGPVPAVPAATGTQVTGTEQTDLDHPQPKLSLTQQIAKSIKQLSQLGAGASNAKDEEGEVEQRLLAAAEQPRWPASAAGPGRQREQLDREGRSEGEGGEEERYAGEAEEADEEGGVAALGRVLESRLRAVLPLSRQHWPTLATAALLLLMLAWGLRASRQAGASRSQVSTLSRQLDTQLEAAATARSQLQAQLAHLQASVQQLQGGMADSSSALGALKGVYSTQEGVIASLQAELKEAKDGIGQLQLQLIAASTATDTAAAMRRQQQRSELGHGADDDGQAAADVAAGTQRLRQLAREEAESVVELFAADRTGLPDYALAAVGGAVVAHSPAHLPPATARLQSLSSLGQARLWDGAVHPQASKMLLAPISQPGTCLPLVGSSGWVDIRLAHPIHPTALSYEHIPASIAFDIRSAPHGLSLTGFRGKPTPLPTAPASAPMATSTHTGATTAAQPQPPSAPGQTNATGAPAGDGGPGIALGSFHYNAHGERAVQTFQLSHLTLPHPLPVIDHVRLSVTSNHGHSGYTCLYRVRVHGTPVAAAPTAAGAA